MLSKSESKVDPGKLWWLGPLTILASIIGVLIVRILAVALIQPDPIPMSLGLVLPPGFTFILVTGAVFVFALVARFTSRPVRIFQIIAFGFLLISLLPDIGFARSPMPGANWPNAIALMVMHVIAWSICVTMLSRWSIETTQSLAVNKRIAGEG
jgi:hypothetical protein